MKTLFPLIPERTQPYVATPILATIWWLVMWFSGGSPGEVLRGEATGLNSPATCANCLFLIVTITSIALYFWLISTNRRRTERLIYALLWPLFSVSIYMFLLFVISGEMAGKPVDEALTVAMVSFIFVPKLLITESWLQVVVGLAVTLVVTEPYAEKMRRIRAEEQGLTAPAPART